MTEFDSNALGQPSDRVSADAKWFALWVRSHFEQLVHDQLRAHGFEMFLPTVKVWSRRGGRRHVVSMPMLPGYLFTHHPMDRHSHVQILQTRGVVSVLGERWDRLTPVKDERVPGLPAEVVAYHGDHLGSVCREEDHLRRAAFDGIGIAFID